MNKTQNGTRDDFPGISYIWYTPSVGSWIRATSSKGESQSYISGQIGLLKWSNNGIVYLNNS